MKKFLRIVSSMMLLTLLTGCLEDGINLYPIRYPNVIFIGDSLCESTVNSVGPTAQNIVGMIQDCEWGRAMVDYSDALPKGYSLIFLGLASNDAVRGVPIELFNKSLKRKLHSVKTPVVCVLPNADNWRMDKYRTAMKTICSNVLDPNEWGVEYRALDGLHMSAKDHRIFAPVLQDVITSFHL